MAGGNVEETDFELFIDQKILIEMSLETRVSIFLANNLRFYLDSVRVSDSFFKNSIKLLENILPQKLQEEWLGDLQEHSYQLIEDGTPLWKVYFITLFTGLGLIRSYLWLEADKLVSRWMTRAK